MSGSVLYWAIAISLIMGIIDHIFVNNEESYTCSFLDIWRHTANYLITAILIYFFLIFRWPRIVSGEELLVSDFIIGFTIFVGVFGWLPYIAKNFTEGINAIISRVLKK